jgi:drug/metabolite transporter (DMT)-like permease
MTGGWVRLARDDAFAILASGFIGIFFGDTAQFLALNRLGPRRTAILFAMNAPLSALLGWIALREHLSGQTVLGIVTVIIGVVLAIAFGTGSSHVHYWERVKGRLWVGLSLGGIAALAQAVGSLIVRPVMASGANPVLVSAMRVGVAALGLSILLRLPRDTFRPTNRFTARMLGMTALSGVLGMGVGMTLIMWALSGSSVGVVSTLAATTPALLLPLLWIRTKEVPAAGAWVGAVLVVVGSGAIFMN